MFELHGWITMRETYKAVDTEEDNLDYIVRLIQEKALKMKWNTPEIKAQSGEYFIELTLFSNRRTEEVDEIFEFLKFIVKSASGSYGLIYVLDSDDRKKGNEFQVYTMHRGSIIEQKDSYLSPIVPTIEDLDF